jgi:SAM-dependent methyltransferase
MDESAEKHRAQVDYWNGSGGKRWAAAQDHTDRMLEPVSHLLLRKAEPKEGMAVLDIGCGGGATTQSLASSVGSGRVVGVDISSQLVELAKSRLRGFKNAEVRLADAAVYPFEPFADLATSRFGVMFFGDPAAAFKNIRKALKPGGRLVFACWQDIAQNPWMTVPLRAVEAAGVPPAPAPGPEDPGPFSFADPARVKRILLSAGFKDIDFAPANLTLDIAAGGGLEAAVSQAMTIGAAAAALRDQPESLRAAAAKTIREALRPYQEGANVSLQAAIWLVGARAP